MKPKFKRGDKVRCKRSVSGRFDSLSRGEVYTVDGIKFGVLVELNEVVGVYQSNVFELVSDRLDTLLETAERGRQAARELVERYKDEIEYEDGLPVQHGPNWAANHVRIVRKKKTIPPLTLPDSGYECRVEGNDVKVGCKTFDISSLKASLNSLCKGRCAVSGNIFAKRDGINYDNNALSWRDADALLEWLEKVARQ